MKKINRAQEPTDRDRELVALMAEPDEAFNGRAFKFIMADDSLIMATVEFASKKTLGRVHTVWGSTEDARSYAVVALHETLRELYDGEGEVHFTNGMGAYLVQWSGSRLRQEVERALPAGSSTAHRREVTLHAHTAEMSKRLQREVSAQEAAEDSNHARALQRCLRPAAKHQVLARISDLPGGGSGDDVRARFDQLLRGATDPQEFSRERRLAWVVDFNKQVLVRNGFEVAVKDHLFARLSDIEDETPAAIADRQRESERLAAALGEYRRTHQELVDPSDLVAAYNRDALLAAGMSALTSSNAIVTAEDKNTAFFPPVDLETLTHAAPVAACSRYQLIEPYENLAMMAELLNFVQLLHRGLEDLIEEMLDAYRRGVDLKPDRDLSLRCNIPRRELPAAMAEVHSTLRQYARIYLEA